MEDIVIEIARFEHMTEAEMLVSLLKSEGIECYVRDSISSSNFFGSVDIGGAKVELLKKDARRALDIMKEYNYEIPEELREINLLKNTEQDNNGIDNTITDDENEYDIEGCYYETSKEDASIDNEVIERRKARLSKQMTVILIIMAILFGSLLFLNKYYTR